MTTKDISYKLGGFHHNNIYYGDPPEVYILYTLSGSNRFSSIEFHGGASFETGSVLLGSFSPSGVLQSFDLTTKTIISIYKTPENLSTENVEDFS